MNEQAKTKLLIDYLHALSRLKLTDYYANREIERTIKQIEQKLGL